MDDEIFAGEITGDRDNESLEEGEDDDEWESESMSEHDEDSEVMNEFEDELADINAHPPSGGPQFDNLFHVISEGMQGIHDDGIGGDMHDDVVDEDLNEDEGQFSCRLFTLPNKKSICSIANVNQDDEGMDEMEEELGEDADDDQESYQGFDEGGSICSS